MEKNPDSQIETETKKDKESFLFKRINMSSDTTVCLIEENVKLS